MENDNRKENGEYQFIREKVVSNKRNRIKRMLLSVGVVVLLAIVFGIVARLVFLCSDGPLRRLLGLEKEMPAPSPTPAFKPTPSPTPTSPPVPVSTETAKASEPLPTLPLEGTEDPSEPGDPENPGKECDPGEKSDPEGPKAPGDKEQPEGSDEPGKEENPGESSEPGIVGPTGGPGNQEDSKDSERPENPEGDPSGAGNKEGTEIVPGGYAAMYEEIREIARKVKVSLVTVTALVTGIDWLNDPYEIVSQTTGIVIEKTAEHLLVLLSLDRIQLASDIRLEIDNEPFDAELWSYDKDYNLAVVAVDSSRIPERFWDQVEVAQWGESSALEAGMPILALGNPNGYIGSMEVGMVTSSGSLYYIVDNSVSLFNTDTTDSEFGDGVIANLKGEIIGIITRTLKSDLNATMCTAVGISGLGNVMAKLAAGEGQIYFGIQGENIPASVLREEGLNCGIYVMEVSEGSPAHEAGIKTGDIILAVDDREVASYGGFHELLNQYAAGDTISVLIRRMIRTNPKNVTIKITLSEKQ